MIVGIVGSRTVGLPAQRCSNIVQYAIRLLSKDDIIMSGGCTTGADYWAKYWAQALGFRYIEAPPNRSRGVSGLFERNKTIVMVSDMVLSIWDGKSHGTLNTMDHCNKMGVPLWVVQL